MKIKFLIAAITLVMALKSQSQPRAYLDSIKLMLKTDISDSLRFRALDELAWNYRLIQADSALTYGHHSLIIAETMDLRFKAISLSTIGIIKKDNGIGDFGISELSQSLKIYEGLKDSKGLAKTLYALGGAYEKKGRLKLAVDFFLKSSKIRRESGNKRKLAMTLNGLGLVYEKLRDFDKALACFEEGLASLEPGDGSKNMFYNNMGCKRKCN